MKKVFFAVILFCAPFILLVGQESDSGPESRDVPPAPVVSGLSAARNGSAVDLSWTAAPDIGGESIILRADRPITAANFASAERVGSVPAEATTFTDATADGRDWYYAILSRDSDGTLYEFFLPASNSLLVPVSAPASRQTVQTASFSAFDAITRNDAVIITWKPSAEGRPLVLYRATAPFTGMESLAQAIVVSSFTDTGAPYVDYPVPGVPYYYAVIDENDISTGSARFSANANTNAVPVEVPASLVRIRGSGVPSLRPMPLPFLNPLSSPETTPATFSPETEKVIASLASYRAVGFAAPERVPYIFPADRETSSGGEDFVLKSIVSSGFASGNWPKTGSELGKFLSIRRTPAATARAHFYLGETLFFSGEYRDALLEFLLSQDLYYGQSREWIQYTLEKLVPAGKASVTPAD